MAKQTSPKTSKKTSLQPETNTPVCHAVPPADFTKPELIIWHQITQQLHELGRLKDHYLAAVEDYCRVLARLAATRKLLDKEGWTYAADGRNGLQIKIRPEVPLLHDDTRKLQFYIKELGLSPNSEKHLKQEKVEFNEFDMFKH